MRYVHGKHAPWKATPGQLNAAALMCDATFVCVSVIDERFPIDAATYITLRIGLTCMAVIARLLIWDRTHDKSK